MAVYGEYWADVDFVPYGDGCLSTELDSPTVLVPSGRGFVASVMGDSMAY